MQDPDGTDGKHLSGRGFECVAEILAKQKKKKKNDKEVAVTQGEGEPRVGRSLEKDRE